MAPPRSPQNPQGIPWVPRNHAPRPLQTYPGIPGIVQGSPTPNATHTHTHTHTHIHAHTHTHTRLPQRNVRNNTWPERKNLDLAWQNAQDNYTVYSLDRKLD